MLPANVAENLSLPRRWKRLPKALTNDEIAKLLTPETPETPESLCDQAILELAYASGLRLVRIEKSCGWSSFISMPGSSTSSARATRSAWCRSGEKPWKR